jgi:hypothetical protein
LRRGRKKKSPSAQTGKTTVFSKRGGVILMRFGSLTQRWPILGIFGVNQMANSVGTIYFGRESAKTLPHALQTSISDYSSAGNHVFRKAINAKANIGRTNTAVRGQSFAFGARLAFANWWAVAPNRSCFMHIKV